MVERLAIAAARKRGEPLGQWERQLGDVYPISLAIRLGVIGYWQPADSTAGGQHLGIVNLNRQLPGTAFHNLSQFTHTIEFDVAELKAAKRALSRTRCRANVVQL